jgi:hypothetical protein
VHTEASVEHEAAVERLADVADAVAGSLIVFFVLHRLTSPTDAKGVAQGVFAVHDDEGVA